VNVVCRATAIAHSLLCLFLKCSQRYLQRLQIELQELQYVAKACHQRICTINYRQATELVVYLVHSFCEHTVAQELMQPDSIILFKKTTHLPRFAHKFVSVPGFVNVILQSKSISPTVQTFAERNIGLMTQWVAELFA